MLRRASDERDRSTDNIAGLAMAEKRERLPVLIGDEQDPHKTLSEELEALHGFIQFNARKYPNTEGLQELNKLVNRGFLTAAPYNYTSYARMAINEKLTCLSYFMEDYKIGQPLKIWHVRTKRSPQVQEVYVEIKARMTKLFEKIDILNKIAKEQAHSTGNQEVESLCGEAINALASFIELPLELLKEKGLAFELAINGLRFLQRLAAKMQEEEAPDALNKKVKELSERVFKKPLEQAGSVDIERRRLELHYQLYSKLQAIFAIRKIDPKETKEDEAGEIKILKNLYLIASQETPVNEAIEYINRLDLSLGRQLLPEDVKAIVRDLAKVDVNQHPSLSEEELIALSLLDETVMKVYRSLVESSNLPAVLVTKLFIPTAIETYVQLIQGKVKVSEGGRDYAWTELEAETKQQHLCELRASKRPFFNNHYSKRDKLMRIFAEPGQTPQGYTERYAYVRDQYNEIERRLGYAGVLPRISK